MPRLVRTALAGSLILAPTAWTQTPFGDARDVATGIPCTNFLVAADMDGDGDPDIVTGSRTVQAVQWFENLGNRTFGPPRTLAGTVGVSAIRVADLDGDSALDVIAADQAGDRIVWYRNLGGGAFDPAADVSTSVPGARWVETADVDGDGDLDVVAVARAGDAVLWVENLGGGAFGAGGTIDGNLPAPHSVAVGDFDGDGDPDVVAASDGDDVIVSYENLGAGVFGPPVTLASQFLLAPEVGVADYDADGVVDVLFPGAACQVYGCRGSGSGTFAPATPLTPALLCGGAMPIQLADHDLDGNADLLLGTYSTNVEWSEGVSAGMFSYPLWVHFATTSCAGTSRQAYDVADLDLDGDLDIANFSAPSTLLWYENTTLAFVDCNGNGVHDPVEIASGEGTDLDGNGVLDECEEIGARVCSPGIANSTGAPGEILVLGSASVADDDVRLAAQSLPAQSTAYFLTSRTSGTTFPVTGSQGRLCVSGSIGRYVGPGQVLVTDSAGTAVLPIDLGALPTPTGPVAALPGATWTFTLWHRDLNPTATSNFTDAVAVTFL
ncbi:MAG: VCBS repeat-containing protein [Planctomycetota bacterium]